MSVFKKSVPFDFPAKIVQVDTAKYCYQIIKMVMSDQETHPSANLNIVCNVGWNLYFPY